MGDSLAAVLPGLVSTPQRAAAGSAEKLTRTSACVADRWTASSRVSSGVLCQGQRGGVRRWRWAERPAEGLPGGATAAQQLSERVLGDAAQGCSRGEAGEAAVSPVRRPSKSSQKDFLYLKIFESNFTE